MTPEAEHKMLGWAIVVVIALFGAAVGFAAGRLW